MLFLLHLGESGFEGLFDLTEHGVDVSQVSGRFKGILAGHESILDSRHRNG